jgi:hypothetical protein
MFNIPFIGLAYLALLKYSIDATQNIEKGMALITTKHYLINNKTGL